MIALRQKRKILNIGVISIFLLYFLLRLYRLGYYDFWYDEIFTIHYSQYPWGNWNAPLYWIFLHFWTKIFSISETTLRLPSAIFSFCSVILVYLLGKKLFNKKVGVVSTLFIGLSPFHLWYAQEARDYSMVLFLGLLSSYMLLNALKNQGFKNWLSFAVVSILGCYTDYFFILLCGSHFLYVSLYNIINKKNNNFTPTNTKKDRPKQTQSLLSKVYNTVLATETTRSLFSFLLIVLGASFYANRFFNKFLAVSKTFWIPKPTLKSILITIENFILGYNSSIFFYILCDIIIAALLVYLLLNIQKINHKKSIVFCVVLFFAPTFFAYVFSRIFFSIYIDRGLIIFSPYFYLILALCLVSMRKIVYRVLLSIFLISLVIANFMFFTGSMPTSVEHHIGTYIKMPVRKLVKFFINEIKPEDILIYTNESVIPSLDFYSGGKITPDYRLFVPKVSTTGWGNYIVVDRHNIPFYYIKEIKFKRLWAIFSDWARSGELDRPSKIVRDWLNKHLKFKFKKEIEGVWVYMYER